MHWTPHSFPEQGQALIRVIASDGVNTGQDDSDAPFAIASKRPEVVILSPDDGTVIMPATAVLLRGTATDAEDGPVPDEALTWTSDRDGALGVGPEVVATLSPGHHVITLAGQDTDSNISTATITVEVVGTTQITYNPANDRWHARHSSTSQGRVLWTDESHIYFYDGATSSVIQEYDPGDPTLDLVEVSVFGLGNGATPGEVVGAWRRGTDFAWVWTNDGGPPVLVNATNPFDPNEPVNPEAVAIADGCVFMVLQAFDPDTNSFAKLVYEIDPVTGDATSLTGNALVPGADRITTSGCQAAWVFDDGTGTPKLHFQRSVAGRRVHRLVRTVQRRRH